MARESHPLSVQAVMTMDVLTKEQRHKAMSHIKSKDTSIELESVAGNPGYCPDEI